MAVEASPEKRLAIRKPVPLHQSTRKTDAVPDARAPAIIKYLCLPTESAIKLRRETLTKAGEIP